MSVRVPVWVPSFTKVMKDRPPSAAEEALLAACRSDGQAWIGEHCPEDTSDPDRAVRAELIRFLLLGGDDAHRPHPSGLWIHGAWIAGFLDFRCCATHLDLGLVRCLLPDRPTLREAQIGAVSLRGSRAWQGCDLALMRVEKGVYLNEGFQATGEVDLSGARIDGQFDCSTGRFMAPLGRALSIDGATVGADVLLRNGFQAKGMVALRSARIGGHLDCSSGQFEAPGGVALDADATVVGVNTSLKEGYHAIGKVVLRGASIMGQLDCSGGRFETPGGVALNADSATVGASLYLRGGFHATGVVNLRGAAITGQLDCHGGRFEGSEGVALTADAATVGADVFLSSGFHATGALNFTRARIDGHLVVQVARIDGVVLLHSARIGEGFFWKGVEGEIPGMDLTEAKVRALHDDAASWDRVRRVLKLDGFSYGSVQSTMTVRERLAWLARDEAREIVPTSVAASYLSVRPLDFDPRPYSELASAYLRMGEKRAAARVLEVREDRLRDAEYWRELAEIDERSDWRANAAWWRRLGLWGFKALFGYGHSPARALLCVLAYWAVASWFFFCVYLAGEFAPNSDVVLTSADWQRAVHLGCPLSGDAAFAARKAAGCVMPQDIWMGGLPDAVPPVPASTAAGDYETFSAWLYAADLFLPLDTIGQTEAWAPSKDRGSWGWWGYWLRFPIQLFGWIMVAMAAAVLAGVIGKKED